MRKAEWVAVGLTIGLASVLVWRRHALRVVEPERPESFDEPDAEAPVTPSKRTGRFTRTKDELYEEARRLDLPGRSKMTKQELAEALEQHRAFAG